MELEEAEALEDRFLFRLLVFGVVVVVLALGFGFLGGFVSCSSGGGELVGFSCSDVDVILACEDLAGSRFPVVNESMVFLL